MMTLEDSGISLHWVLAISRREMEFTWRKHVAGETLENIVENIEEVIVAVNVAVILRTQLPT